MNKKHIKIPKNTRRLSDFKRLDELLPIKGKFITNKILTGCGFTYYYLTNEVPVILLSPRLELLHSKEHLPNVFYFKNSTLHERIQSIRMNLYNYLMKSSINPYNLLEKEIGLSAIPPKIMVTYDSVGYLLDYLKELNLLEPFTIVVDEFHCLLTDSGFKANTELTTLHQLMSIPNRTILVSATPFSDSYLESMDFFKDLDYYYLDWNNADKEEVKIQYIATNRTPRELVGEIISNYRRDGYFQAKIIEGETKYSREALFYLNKVNDIVSIIEDNKLKPEEVLVVCSKNEKNRVKLRTVGVKIGHFNREEDRGKNKPFTFITKASFEGADLYSDTGTTYIFSNPNQKTLALDLSIDITQIIGRNRIATNPFRKDIFFYYKTSTGAIGNVIPSLKNEEEYLDLVADKVKETERLLKLHSTTTDRGTLQLLKKGVESNGFKDSYFDIIEEDGELKPVMNILAYSNELRAYDVFTKMYKTKLEVLKNIDNLGFRIEDNEVVNNLANELNRRGNFIDKMKFYIQYLDLHKDSYNDIQSSLLIPFNLKQYYVTLGAERIKALSYREVDLKAELDYLQTKHNIIQELTQHFRKGQRYSCRDAKKILADIYKKLGIDKKARASDIGKFIHTKKVTVTLTNGKRNDGIEIL